MIFRRIDEINKLIKRKGGTLASCDLDTEYANNAARVVVRDCNATRHH